ncbi:hypothetical protein PG993_003854 [Apiospora rasikravindrae]|uniref:Uncharacterized protein n=1 Tax=Apiospora rasikravindrae TaxID=990691 RepID=A0ABR1U0P5_9PEZI
MAGSQMSTAVLQSTVLQTIGEIAAHHISEGAYDDSWDDPVFMDWSVEVLNRTAPFSARHQAAAAALANSSSTALAANTTSSLDAIPEPNLAKSFYGHHLPRGMIACLLMSTLFYLWAVALERAFPTRPRGAEGDTTAPYPKEEKVVVELSEEHEEEVVKRWIARGRVRRSSISWCNTLIKWLLEVVVRAALEGVILDLFDALVDGKWEKYAKAWWGIPKSCFDGWTNFWLTGGPLVSFASLVIVPAPQRVVAEGAFYMFAKVFVQWLLPKFAAWLIRQDAAQKMFREQTQTVREVAQQKKWTEKGRLMEELRFLDEL